MFIYISLFVFLSMNSIMGEYLFKEEGDDCEWEGLPGKCVQENRCLTSLDYDSPRHAVCSTKFKEKIICCTDCQLVNNTENAIFSPAGLLWKDGQKTRDACLQYLQDLPYKCKGDDFNAGITRELNENKKCYDYTIFDRDSDLGDRDPRVEYPHYALLGYENDQNTEIWKIGGSIISNKYILTTARSDVSSNFSISVAAVNLNEKPPTIATSQIYRVKRFIPHPDYENLPDNNIALVEIEDTITFNKNVLPACLHNEATDYETATGPYYNHFENSQILISCSCPVSNGTIKTIKLDKISDEECKAAYKTVFKDGINSDLVMCYGNKTETLDDCKEINKAYNILGGQPLQISTPFSGCMYSIIGLYSFSFDCPRNPIVFTRVAPYIPWIESVVWP